jgi:hypothetical protein
MELNGTPRSKRKTSDSQGVLQDGDVGDSALPLFNSGRSGGDEAERDGGGDGGDGELHYELESKGCLVGKRV